VIALGGIPNKVHVGYIGVDGHIFPVGTKPSDDGLYADDWFPIQVKQTDKVGRPDIDAFQAVPMSEWRARKRRRQTARLLRQFRLQRRRQTRVRRVPQTHR
jgi:hypothetical protein